jgi:hypothetical protein
MRQLFGDGGAVRVEKQSHLGLALSHLFLELCATQRGFRHDKILLDEMN